MLAGCGGSGGGTRVQGKVLLNDKPLAGAEVLLEGKEKGAEGGYGGKTNEQGEFDITSTGSKPIKPGTYRVLISKYVDKQGRTPDPEEFEQMRARGELVNLLPHEYSDPASSDLFAEVKEGVNVLKPFSLRGRKK
jgi:hypothetical protein